MPSLAAHILHEIKTCIERIAPDAKAILYGSYARGDARSDSDVDILILLPDYYEAHEFVSKKIDLSGQLYDLSLSLGIDISPLITATKVFFSRKTPFTINIANEGIEL